MVSFSIGQIRRRTMVESIVFQRTKELSSISERLMLEKEERMIELKVRINQLSKKLGRPQAYDISFLEKEKSE